MTEEIFNLFVYVSGEMEIIDELGVASHKVDGTDEQKLAHLQAAVDSDYAAAKRYPVPNRYMLKSVGGEMQPGRITYATFVTRIEPTEFFEEVFADHNAGQDPLMCITCIMNGEPVIDYERRF